MITNLIDASDARLLMIFIQAGASNCKPGTRNSTRGITGLRAVLVSRDGLFIFLLQIKYWLVRDILNTIINTMFSDSAYDPYTGVSAMGLNSYPP